MARNIHVYQIDFTAVASGKRIASTKRRVRWRFGFADPQALANGLTGTACRGEEHDVTIVWSLTSGKRLVLSDGREIHYSNSRNNIFEFSWTMRGNHVLKIIAHASPPLSPTPGFRQYDFFVDGQSFFSFPKVFRLGLAPNDPRARSPRSPPSMADRGSGFRSGGPASTRSATGIASLEAPHNPDEEELYLQEAIKNSLVEARPPAAAPSSAASVQSAPPPSGGGDLLLDFGAPAATGPPAMATATAVATLDNNMYGAPPPAAGGAMQSFSGPFGAPQAIAPTPSFDSTAYSAPPPMATAIAYPPTAHAGAAGAIVPAPTSNPYANVVPPQPQQAQAPFGQAPPQPPAAPAQNYAQMNGQMNGFAQPPAPMPAPAPAPAVAPENPFGSFAAPAPVQTQAPPQPASLRVPPPTAAPASNFLTTPKSVTAPQPGFTPNTTTSSLGFASPGPFGVAESAPNTFAPQQPPASMPAAMPAPAPAPAVDPSAAAFGFQPAPPAPAPAPVQGGLQFSQPPESAPAPSSNPALTMSTLAGGAPDLVAPTPGTQNGSMADQAYAKLANLDSFSLMQDTQSSVKNPFDDPPAAAKNNTASLADIRAKKSDSSGQKKEVMKSNALVLSSNQTQGNYGGYGAQYGMASTTMSQQSQRSLPPQQPPSMMNGGGQQMAPPMQQQYGQQPPSMMNGGGQQMPPPVQQQYGQQQYGQQQPPAMQQQSFGGFQQQYPQQGAPGYPPQQQQQQQMYGQQMQQQQQQPPYGQQMPPPIQQQSYGQQPFGGF